jgi:predicted RND superfamily exporter protein
VKRFSDLVIRFRVPVIAVTLAVTLGLGYFIKDTRVNSDILGYLPKNDPAVQLNNHVGELFGGTQLAVIALETGDVFTASCLAHVASLTADIADVEGVASVTSLADVIDIRKSEEGLDVGRLMEPGASPRTAEELAAFRAYVLSRDLYRGRLVSADATATLIVARIDEAADKSQVAAQIRRTVQRAGLTERVYYAGLPFQLIEISGLVAKDMIWLIPIAALLIVAALFASFRRLRGVVLPLVSVGISTVWVVGVMALFRVPFSLRQRLQGNRADGEPEGELADGSRCGDGSRCARRCDDAGGVPLVPVRILPGHDQGVRHLLRPRHPFRPRRVPHVRARSAFLPAR